MFASILTGQYCSVHHLLFVTSLQEWLPFSPAHIEDAFGDAMQVIEATCPRCLVTDKTAKVPHSIAFSGEMYPNSAKPSAFWTAHLHQEDENVSVPVAS